MKIKALDTNDNKIVIITEEEKIEFIGSNLLNEIIEVSEKYIIFIFENRASDNMYTNYLIDYDLVTKDLLLELYNIIEDNQE